MYFGLNAVLRSASKPRHAMFATIFTVVINTLLDPIFIYTFQLGIRGAAYATILSQILALIWQMKLFSNKKELIRFTSGTYRKDLVRNIIGIGMSPFAMNVCACIVVIFINKGFVAYGGDLAVGAYGIDNRVAFFFIMITMGVTQGMQPIAGYNYGSQQLDRLMKVLRYSVYAGVAVMTTGFLVAMFLPELCVRMFTSDETLIAMAVRGIRIDMAAFPVVGYQMVVTNFFQSIGKAKISMFLSLSRQLLFLIPLLIVLPPQLGVDGVWLSLPVSDVIAAIVAAVMMFIYMKKFNRQHKELTYGKQENYH